MPPNHDTDINLTYTRRWAALDQISRIQQELERLSDLIHDLTFLPPPTQEPPDAIQPE